MVSSKYINDIMKMATHIALLDVPEGHRRATRNGANTYLAFATLVPQPDNGYLLDVICAHRGFGKKMLGSVISYVRDVLGANYLELHSLSHVIGFYNAHGFTFTSKCHTPNQKLEHMAVAVQPLWSKDRNVKTKRLRKMINLLKAYNLANDDCLEHGVTMTKCFGPTTQIINVKRNLRSSRKN